MDTRTLSVPDSGSTGSVDSRSYSGSGNIPDRSISSIPGDNASSMDSGMEDISSSNGLGIHKVRNLSVPDSGSTGSVVIPAVIFRTREWMISPHLMAWEFIRYLSQCTLKMFQTKNSRHPCIVSICFDIL